LWHWKGWREKIASVREKNCFRYEAENSALDVNAITKDMKKKNRREKVQGNYLFILEKLFRKFLLSI
jgi:hypothetical protein